MNHGGFIVAAYALTVGATAALVAWAWLSMRRAEAAADRIRQALPSVPAREREGK